MIDQRPANSGTAGGPWHLRAVIGGFRPCDPVLPALGERLSRDQGGYTLLQTEAADIARQVLFAGSGSKTLERLRHRRVRLSVHMAADAG